MILLYNQILINPFYKLMEQICSLLSLDNKKHLIIGASVVQFEAFVKKAIDEQNNNRIINKISNENIIIKSIHQKDVPSSQCQFINSFSLSLFMNTYICLGLELLKLKKITLIFLEPQLDYSHIKLFSPQNVYGIKGWDYNCPIKPNEIDLSSLTFNFYTKLFHFSPKKQKIFNIQKMPVRNRKTNKRHRQSYHRTRFSSIIKNQKTLGANSLISISKEIKIYTQKHLCVTSLHLIQYIIDLVKEANKSHFNQKEVSLLNIHRRVYDAINIMGAIGLIKKENNRIIWINKLNEEQPLASSSTLPEIIKLNEFKKRQLKQKATELNLYTHFYHLNRDKEIIDERKNKAYFPLNYSNSLEHNDFIPMKKENNLAFVAINSLNKQIIPYELLIEKISSSMIETLPYQTNLFEEMNNHFTKPSKSSNDYSSDGGNTSKNFPSIFDIDFRLNIENTY